MSTAVILNERAERKDFLSVLPDAVDPVLGVIELDRRAGPQIQRPDGLLALQQKQLKVKVAAEEQRRIFITNSPLCL